MNALPFAVFNWFSRLIECEMFIHFSKYTSFHGLNLAVYPFLAK
jgi:hypothetical protein